MSSRAPRPQAWIIRVLAGIASIGVSGAAIAQQAPTPAAIIGLLPDTQYYSETPAWTRHFQDQTGWLAARRDILNVRFVGHLGDIVDNGASRPAEWDRARGALATLQSVIPHSVCLGNHDYQVVSDKASGNDTYFSYFGREYHATQPGYLESDPQGVDHALMIDLGGGRSMLHLVLQWRPDETNFAWARSVLARYPGVPVIISTHEHVRDPDNAGAGAGRSPAGEFTWTSFIRNEPRVAMIFNGHFHSGQAGYAGEYMQTSLNTAGLSVHEFLSDYQGWAEGGQGYMRLVTIDPQNRELRVRGYSPSTGKYLRDHNSDMRFAYDFDRRFANEPARDVVERKFRQGLSGYALALDVELRSAAPDTAVAAGSMLTVTAPNNGGGATQGLIKFGDLFGEAPGQLGADDDILVAKLRFNVNDAGSGFTVHRLLAPFGAASTWNSMVGGISSDGTEAMATPDCIAGGGTANGVTPFGLLELDVTRSLRAWKAGEPNHGWALIPHSGGTNAVSFYSSDYFLLGKPELVVWTASSGSRTITLKQGVDGYTAAADSEIREADQSAFIPEAPSIFIDADQPAGTGMRTTGLMRFADLFTAGRVPQDAWITSATLTLTVTEQGSGLSVHRMLRSWNEWDGWSRFGPVDLNEVDAIGYPEDEAGRESSSATVQRGALRLDVTDSVRQWQAGKPNEGWALLARAGGTDGLRIASSEAVNPAERPELTIRFVAPCGADFNRDGFLDFFDYDDFVMCFEAGRCPPGGSADFNRDGFLDFFDYDDFVVAFGEGC